MKEAPSGFWFSVLCAGNQRTIRVLRGQPLLLFAYLRVSLAFGFECLFSYCRCRPVVISLYRLNVGELSLVLYEERIVKANKDFKCTLDACPVEVLLENITNAMLILTSQLKYSFNNPTGPRRA